MDEGQRWRSGYFLQREAGIDVVERRSLRWTAGSLKRAANGRLRMGRLHDLSAARDRSYPEIRLTQTPPSLSSLRSGPHTSGASLHLLVMAEAGIRRWNVLPSFALGCFFACQERRRSRMTRRRR